jgi:hypothetical protein
VNRHQKVIANAFNTPSGTPYMVCKLSSFAALRREAEKFGRDIPHSVLEKDQKGADIYRQYLLNRIKDNLDLIRKQFRNPENIPLLYLGPTMPPRTEQEWYIYTQSAAASMDLALRRIATSPDLSHVNPADLLVMLPQPSAISQAAGQGRGAWEFTVLDFRMLGSAVTKFSGTIASKIAPDQQSRAYLYSEFILDLIDRTTSDLNQRYPDSRVRADQMYISLIAPQAGPQSEYDWYLLAQSVLIGVDSTERGLELAQRLTRSEPARLPLAMTLFTPPPPKPEEGEGNACAPPPAPRFIGIVRN